METERHKCKVHDINDDVVVLEMGNENEEKALRAFPKNIFDKNISKGDDYMMIVSGGAGWMQIDFKKSEPPLVMIDDDDTVSNTIKDIIHELNDREFINKCKDYAIKQHRRVNQLYDGQPYDKVHLKSVVDFGLLFIELIPKSQRANVIGGLWNHDTIEDTGITLNDLIKGTNKEVGEIAYALTNEKGRNRDERANAKYYRGIRNTMFADYCKLCDRLANVHYSLMKKNSYKGEGMFDKYKKEHPKFIWSIIKPEWYEISEHILRLFMGHKRYLKQRKEKHEYARVITHLENMFNNK